MTKHLLESWLFASVAVNATLLIFIAGVLRKMMNAVDEATFKNLIALLVRYSSRSAFMIIALNIPLILAVPYYYRYGFSNRWITLGLVLWLVTGSVSKFYKLPVYKSLASLQSTAVFEIKKERGKFNAANIIQAILYSVAAVLVAFGL